MKVSFNDKHPELREGEMFLQNVFDPQVLFLREAAKCLPGLDFESIQFSSKRLGEVAYDEHGKVLPLARPVFVNMKQWELEELTDWGYDN